MKITPEINMEIPPQAQMQVMQIIDGGGWGGVDRFIMLGDVQKF
jgi:hypothetical protein